MQTRADIPSSCRESGISALELFVIVVIIAAVAAVGVPTLHAKAESAVLDANMQSLSSLVQEEMMQGYHAAYQPSGVGRADTYLSSRLEQVLAEAVGRARYVNPYAGDRERADVVVNSSVIPSDPLLTPPAVFITDNAQCAHEVFDTETNQLGRRHLPGSLLIEFNSAAASIEVFYVNRQGNSSPDVMRFPVG